MKLIFTSVFLLLVSLLANSEDKQLIIDKEAVRLVIRNNLSIFKKCYDDAYKIDSSLHGKIVLGWEINSEGDSARSWIKSTQLNNKNVEDCLTEKVRTLKFPKTPIGTTAEVQFPFIFQGKK